MPSRIVSKAPEKPVAAPQKGVGSDRLVAKAGTGKALLANRKITKVFPIKDSEKDIVYLEEDDFTRLNKSLKSINRRGLGVFFACPRCFVSVKHFKVKQPGDKIAECELCGKLWKFVIDKHDYDSIA